MARKDLNESLLDNLAPVSAVTVYAASDLGTTASKVVAGVDDKYRNRLVKILNGSSSNRIAWQLVERGAAAPTFNANFAANAGSILLPETESEWLSIPRNCDLYLIGSAASSSYCVSVIER